MPRSRTERIDSLYRKIEREVIKRVEEISRRALISTMASNDFKEQSYPQRKKKRSEQYGKESYTKRKKNLRQINLKTLRNKTPEREKKQIGKRLTGET